MPESRDASTGNIRPFGLLIAVKAASILVPLSSSAAMAAMPAVLWILRTYLFIVMRA